MKIVFLSNAEEDTTIMRLIFGVPPEAFEFSVVHDAKAILEDMDFEDLSTVIFLDLHHPQAEDVLLELNLRKITTQLIVMVLCRLEHSTRDTLFGRYNGASYCFLIGKDWPYKMIQFLLEERDTRGLT